VPPIRFRSKDRVDSHLTRFQGFSPVWCAFDCTVTFLFATSASRRPNRGVGSLFGFVNNEQGRCRSQRRRSFFFAFLLVTPRQRRIVFNGNLLRLLVNSMAGISWCRPLFFLQPRPFRHRPKIRRGVVPSSTAIRNTESRLLPPIDQIKQGAKKSGHKGSQGDGQNARLGASSRAMGAAFEFQLPHASWDIFARQAICLVCKNCPSASVRMGNKPPAIWRFAPTGGFGFPILVPRRLRVRKNM